MEQSRSPKGKFRMVTALVLALVAGYILYPYGSGELLDARGQEWVLRGLGALVLNTAFYWGMRLWILHTRTHELADKFKQGRQDAQLIAHAIVTLAAYQV